MFRGLYEHSIDSNGRTSMPARLHEMLLHTALPSPSREDDKADKTNKQAPANTLIITTGIDRCLVAYPLPVWQDFERRLGALSQFDPVVVKLKRIYIAGANECSLDRHRRMQIPALLRDYAGISGDLVWAGMVNTIEIWSKERWHEQMNSLRENNQERTKISTALAGLGL